MSIINQEGSWTSGGISGNVASTTIVPTFSGGGAELLVVPFVVDSSNGCTGATLSAHANLTLGATYTSAATNGVVQGVAWGTWNGAASSPSLILNYTGGNSGAGGGKVQIGVFTGYAPSIISSPGPSGFGSGSSATASATVNSVIAGSLVIAQMDNNASHTFTAGSGFTLAFNTSVWFTNHITGLEYTTGLSSAGGTITPQATLTSSAWSMLAIAIPPAGTAYSLSAAQGSFALTGEAALRDIMVGANQGSFALSGKNANALRQMFAPRGLFGLTGNLANLTWAGAGNPLTGLPASYYRWIPFQLACRLRYLQRGSLNVGNTQQNLLHFLALAQAEANAPSNPNWARYSLADNEPNKLMIRPAYVPGFVRPPAL